MAVGYRVRSPRGTQFRRWSSERLREYLVKGFTLDDERLKNPGVAGSAAPDRFDELLERVRFMLGGDVLKPYKTSIDRWLWPDVFKNHDTSVAKAKKAIADYKKAVVQAEGLAELMVFYCERAAGFCSDIGLQDEGYFNALVRMFEQALKTIDVLAEELRPALLARLDSVRHSSHDFGYGVGDELGELLAEYARSHST